VHLYEGSGQAVNSREGATMTGGSPPDSELYGSLERIESYDMIVSDCEGQGWDGKDGNFSERVANGAKLREYVNRGGRLFASHLSFTWLYDNGDTEYSSTTSLETGLDAVATWDLDYQDINNLQTSGTGVASVVGARPLASPRIQNFADWLVSEDVEVTTAPGYSFPITDPRSLATGLGASSEEFVYRANTPINASDPGDPNTRVQQFSFNTPYGAPDEAACGRVAYSGFHVAATGGGSNPFVNAVFPAHCRVDSVSTPDVNESNLTSQEKVLLYMLFDLGACVGDTPLPPPCVPITCNASGVQRCGYTPDGCGSVLDCGACRPPA
jgi:hypothetical protein